MTGTTVYGAYTIDEDPFVTHVVHDSRGTPLIVHTRTAPDTPEFPRAVRTCSIAAEFAAGASPNCGPIGRRWPCDCRYGIWNPRKMGALDETGGQWMVADQLCITFPRGHDGRPNDQQPRRRSHRNRFGIGRLQALVRGKRWRCENRQAISIWMFHPEFAHQCARACFAARRPRELTRQSPIQLWIRGGLARGSIDVQIQGERGRCGVG
jgi:hypothetical protein